VIIIKSIKPSRRLSKRYSALVLVAKVLLINIGLLSSSSAQELTQEQSQLFINNCLQCHSNAETGAPVIGNTNDWVDVVAKGEDKIVNNVIQGIRGMPPLGYCSACSKDDFRVLIRFMTNTNSAKNEKNIVSKEVK